MAALAGSGSAKRSTIRKSTPDMKQWQIFNSLDLQEESEMLQIASFYQVLIQEFSPQATESKESRRASVELLSDEENDDQQVDDDELDERAAVDFDNEEADSTAPGPNGTMIQCTSIKMVAQEEPYVLPKGPISQDTALEIIEVYRAGGVLSEKAYKKVMKEGYKKLKVMPNVIHVPCEEGTTVQVVGDIHGQLQDLLHILDETGPPSETNKYIFNGDFVDRGTQSVEVIGILWVLMIAWPGSVFLNRGNHEDGFICNQLPPPHGCGGFKQECNKKYTEMIYLMVVEVFKHLPVCTVIDNKVFVVHGGLFHRDGVTLDDINQCKRTAYIPVPRNTETLSDYDKDKAQLMCDALWSDPRPEMGTDFNEIRKQGQSFGPDNALNFLETNGLNMVVRSHECVRVGFAQPYIEHPDILCTVFSASGYNGANNMGAYLTFSKSAQEHAFLVRDPKTNAPTDLSYIMSNYTCNEAAAAIEKNNRMSVRAVVMRKRKDLLEAMSAADETGTGRLPVIKWSQIMAEVTGVVLDWAVLLPMFNMDADSEEIDYRAFMNGMQANFNKFKDLDNQATDMLFDAMYMNRAVLEIVFDFFDTNGDGMISPEEFHAGCKVINEKLPPSQHIADPVRILSLLDVDSSDGIDINEFFEAFRLADAADGSLDGLITQSIA